MEFGPAPGLPFCGWAHLSIRDSDGHSRQIKGSSVQYPLMGTVEGDNVIVEANLVVSNPLSFIQISNEDSYFFTASFIMGSCHHGHRALDHVLCQSIPVACSNFKNQTEATIECLVPFAKGTANKFPFTVTLADHKLVTKVARVRAVIPKSVVQEVLVYRDSLRKYRQLENGDSEKEGNSKGSSPVA
jgi:hypothetical protein